MSRQDIKELIEIKEKQLAELENEMDDDYRPPSQTYGEKASIPNGGNKLKGKTFPQLI